MTGETPFHELRKNHYGAVLADPPWRFNTWNKATAIKRHRSSDTNVSAAVHYDTMSIEDIAALPVKDVAAQHCALFLWCSWPMLQEAMWVVRSWDFEYKTCAFDWVKAHVDQIDMFREDADALMGMGYWTRANSEPCLLAVRGRPKRKSKGVRMGIIEPRREHSRKPDCVHSRIEQLVDGPYLELFARRYRPRWTVWGEEVETYEAKSDIEAERLLWMGREERRREVIKNDGRLNLDPGPLFS